MLYALLLTQEVPGDHSQLWRMLFQKSIEAASANKGLASTATDSDSENSDSDTTATTE
jgi:hypothetical protein